MTQEQINLIAKTLKESRPTEKMFSGFNSEYAEGHDAGELSQQDEICKRIADAIFSVTPNFNRVEFLKDCGYIP